MSHLCAFTRGTRGKIIRIYHGNFQTATCSINSHTSAISSSANDKQIVFTFGVLEFLQMFLARLQLKVILLTGLFRETLQRSSKLFTPKRLNYAFLQLFSSLIKSFNRVLRLQTHHFQSALEAI